MAKVTWTDEQRKVIELRNRNILVSAAAGSGKTAVLVERIISLITEGDHPMDIDRLLIVTFTKAAAAEMRERIGAAIEERLLQDGGNEHLQRQQTLLHGAQITTIDSFCMYVVRNYFHLIDLDPAFRVGEEAELTLLRSDIIGELLERHYEAAEPEFLTFVECYAPGKSDQGLEELIGGLYEFARSYPWPEQWLEEQAGNFEVTSLEELNQKNWMKQLLAQLEEEVKDLMRRNDEAAAICMESGGPEQYLPAIKSDYDLLLSLTGYSRYEEYYRAFQNVSFVRLSAKRVPDVEEQKKETVKAIREEIKKGISDIIKEFFFQPPEEMLADMRNAAGAVRVLVDLTKEYARDFAAAKEEKNMLDFGDLEHFALRILVGEGQAAKELSAQFEEIMIDEYQDSNLVQETILNSISRERDGHPNVFMVGDVKQSIYKFRLARPELFLQKYLTYSAEDGLYQKIDLHKNFRSRAIVLHSANYIFEQIMTKGLGGIAYDESAALYPGASFPECEEGKVSESTEILILDGAKEETEDSEADSLLGTKDSQEEQESLKELEARMIAQRIEELTGQNGLSVWDKERKEYRPAEYRDIVILLRTMSGWSEVFAETFGALGIPAYADTQTGYFQTVEIKTMLNLLRILDNPRQDIPLAAVLYSPIVGLKSRHLARMRAEVKSAAPLCLYETIRRFAEDEGRREDELAEKVSLFLTQYDSWREQVPVLPVHELIELLFEQTGYYDYVSVMPAGERRERNMERLVVMAVQFEKAGYHGLFRFVRYVEKLLQYNVDYGEVSAAGENDNTVRIMSIHKSKGLEFPIVIVAGLGKAFNQSDARAKLVLHPDLGIGPDYIDPVLRIKAPTLLKKAVQRQIKLENLSEELRVLYVALTRAKEKLILTGSVKDFEKQSERWLGITRQPGREFLLHRLTTGGCFLDYIMPALVRHPDGRRFFEIGGVILEDAFAGEGAARYTLVRKKAGELAGAELIRQAERLDGRSRLLSWNPDKVYRKEYREEIERILGYQYPYEEEKGVPVKLTVSELKKAEQKLESEAKSLIPEEIEPTIPQFISKKEAVTAAGRGTLYHKLLQGIPLQSVRTVKEVTEYIRTQTDRKRLPAQAQSLIRSQDIAAFLQTELAERMRKADREGRLYREQAFVIGLPARECGYGEKAADPDQQMLVQGIIDVCLEEEDGLVLIDYKTDHVPEDGEAVLKERYRAQLDFYEKALVQMTGKPVKEKLIYSFALRKIIAL